MRNITVADDDETQEGARVAAAAPDMQVSALGLAAQEPEMDGLKRQEREIRRRITAFQVSGGLSREELHGRPE